MLAVRCGLLTIKLNRMIGKYLDYENEKFEKGYRPFQITRDNFKQNIGKKICFVTTRDTDKHRGTYFVRHATIHSVRYSQLYLGENGHGQVDIRDILECGIFIEETEGSNDC
jgi:hypothetical protein